MVDMVDDFFPHSNCRKLGPLPHVWANPDSNFRTSNYNHL